MKKFLAVFMIFAMMTSMAFADIGAGIITHETDDNVIGSVIINLGADPDEVTVDVGDFILLEAQCDVQNEFIGFPMTQKGGKGKGNSMEKANPKVGHFALKYDLMKDVTLDDIDEVEGTNSETLSADGVVIPVAGVIAVHVKVIEDGDDFDAFLEAYEAYLEALVRTLDPGPFVGSFKDFMESSDPLVLALTLGFELDMIETGWLAEDAGPAVDRDEPFPGSNWATYVDYILD
jgi:hypothetical protein